MALKMFSNAACAVTAAKRFVQTVKHKQLHLTHRTIQKHSNCMHSIRDVHLPQIGYHFAT